MSDPFIGEIKIVGFSFAPNGWAQCDGQLLSIAQNSALFSLFGTYYGGDGRTTFGLPELRGRFPMHYGNGPGLTNRNLGQGGGAESETLSISEMPSHSHGGAVVTSTDEGDRTSPSGAYPARPEEPVQPYAGTAGDAMAAGSVQIDASGSGVPFDKMPPFEVLNFVVALVGIYPSRP
ncbi:phage tail protein [bacterium]|nr:phage tail protein [bacterium]